MPRTPKKTPGEQPSTRAEEPRQQHQHVIIAGTPKQGYVFYGPFVSHEEAMFYALGDLKTWTTPWEVAPLLTPNLAG